MLKRLLEGELKIPFYNAEEIKEQVKNILYHRKTRKTQINSQNFSQWSNSEYPIEVPTLPHALAGIVFFYGGQTIKIWSNYHM